MKLRSDIKINGDGGGNDDDFVELDDDFEDPDYNEGEDEGDEDEDEEEDGDEDDEMEEEYIFEIDLEEDEYKNMLKYLKENDNETYTKLVEVKDVIENSLPNITDILNEQITLKNKDYANI